MKIVIFPWAKGMRSEKPHPKNYPWWPELILALEDLGHEIIQVGSSGEQQLVPDSRTNLKLDELRDLLFACDTWISVDSFGQHFAWDLGIKGIVIFAQSDPNIFGHKENVNLLKSREYLREKQFWLWEQAEFNEEAFVPVEDVVAALAENF
jgi:ADP-heptose:LPS heptosyltransferase